MKNLILCLVLFGFISAGHSQILLKEARVDYKPESMMMDPVSNQLVIKVPEKRVGEFDSDPLTFFKNRFDIQKLLVDNEQKNYDFYIVNFKSDKGFLRTFIKNDGTLVSSFQKFKNVKLPDEARLQILSKYRDAAIVGSKYRASSNGWDLTKEVYKVKIKDGDKTRRLKINKQRGYSSLAGQ